MLSKLKLSEMSITLNLKSEKKNETLNKANVCSQINNNLRNMEIFNNNMQLYDNFQFLLTF